MIAKSIVTSAPLSDDATIYEKIIPSAYKKVKATGNVKPWSKTFPYSKISKSSANSMARNKFSKVSKTKEELREFPLIAKQLTTRLKCIATILFLGVLISAIAMALTIYFVLTKKSENPNKESEKTLLLFVRAPPIVPGFPHPDRSQCYIMSQWLPRFDFITYGEHAVKAMGYFYAIKDEYYTNRKQIREPALNVIIGEGRRLITKLSDTVRDMHKHHYHNDLDYDVFGEQVGRWVQCIVNVTVRGDQRLQATSSAFASTQSPRVFSDISASSEDPMQNFHVHKGNQTQMANCNAYKEKLVQVMTTYEGYTKKIETISMKLEAIFRNFSNLVLQEPKLCPMGELLARYVKGFTAYFESLRTIVSAHNIRLQQNIKSSAKLANISSKPSNITNYKEYACLIIAQTVLDEISKPDEMLWFGEAQGKAVLTYWEDNNVAQHFTQILDNLKNDSMTEAKIRKILEKWKLKTLRI